MPENEGPPEALREILTARQVEILQWAAKGYSSEETADGLKLTESTIKRQRELLINRLRARNITHAVHLAHTMHLFPESKQ